MLLQNKSIKKFVCGIDEAGRGPLAGPVYAAAVILNEDFPCNMLNDSKKLSALKREELRLKVCSSALAWGVGWATHEEIDKINILQASLLAMKRAFQEMMSKNTSLSDENISVIADGNFAPDIPVSCRAMIKADAEIHEVMAASIIAKQERDDHMDKMALLYPQYCYEKHKGYPTKLHRDLIKKYGPSPIQRLSFSVR